MTFTVFVHDTEMATLDTRKIQEPALRFYDKPWDVDRHRYPNACLGRYSRPNDGTCPCGSIGVPRKDIRRRIRLGPMPAKAATRKSPGEQITLQQKMDPSKRLGRRFLCQLDDWEEEANLETYIASGSDWIHRDSFRWRLLTQTKEENNVGTKLT